MYKWNIFSSILFPQTDTGSLKGDQVKYLFSALNDTYSVQFLGHPVSPKYILTRASIGESMIGTKFFPSKSLKNSE